MNKQGREAGRCSRSRVTRLCIIDVETRMTSCSLSCRLFYTNQRDTIHPIWLFNMRVCLPFLLLLLLFFPNINFTITVCECKNTFHDTFQQISFFLALFSVANINSLFLWLLTATRATWFN